MRPAVVRGSSGRTRGKTSNYTPTITTDRKDRTGRPASGDGGGGNGGIHQPHFTPSPWRDLAACANHEDPEIFFPTDANLPNIQLAQQVCAHCPVKTQCLVWALENKITDGIWGASPSSSGSSWLV